MKRLLYLIFAFICLVILTSCRNGGNNKDISIPDHVMFETFMPADQVSMSYSETSQYIPSYSAPEEETEPTAQVDEITTPPDTTSASTEVCEPQKDPEDEYVISDLESVMYANASVNVRELPDVNSKRIGHFDEGDEVRITGIVSNGWYRVSFKNGEYFVNGMYLSDEKQEEVTENTESKTEKPSDTVTKEPASSATEPTTDSEPVIISDIEDDVFLDEPDFWVPSNKYNAINYPVQKAVWFAYLDIDAMLADSTRESFTASVMQAFSNVVSMGCNTVYVHVRAFGDSYYYSNIYPFAASYSGTLGSAPDFDPLAIMVEQAHNMGLSFHAWINPMRTMNKKRYEEMSPYCILKEWYNSSSANGTYIVYDEETGYYWLSPAYSAVRELICSGIAEIVSNYNVDGIHIDDYFYPTTDESFDKLAFSVSGSGDLTEWRRNTVSRLVKDIYQTVKTINSSVVFGVSPQGNVNNNKNKLYADVEKWCGEYGYIDYIVPQIYYGFKDKLPFDSTAEQWRAIVKIPDIKLVCGIAAYKVGSSKEWKEGDILARQTDYSRSLGYAGCAYYRYGSLFGSDSKDSLFVKEYNNLLSSVLRY